MSIFRNDLSYQLFHTIGSVAAERVICHAFNCCSPKSKQILRSLRPQLHIDIVFGTLCYQRIDSIPFRIHVNRHVPVSGSAVSGSPLVRYFDILIFSIRAFVSCRRGAYMQLCTEIIHLSYIVYSLSQSFRREKDYCEYWQDIVICGGFA